MATKKINYRLKQNRQSTTKATFCLNPDSICNQEAPNPFYAKLVVLSIAILHWVHFPKAFFKNTIQIFGMMLHGCWCSLMLVTVRLICCFLWIFSMLIASFECWLPMPTLKYTRFCQNWEKPSPTFFSYQYTFSDIRQQHRCNPRRFWHLLVRTHLSTIVSLNLFLDTNSCHFSVCSNDLTTLGFFLKPWVSRSHSDYTVRVFSFYFRLQFV